ncbi:MAG: hypothetical protein VX874_08550 [Pseudomonadota bacterium]|nr:hypothetical protein [Pseudomonadota bacterium]
MKTPSLKRFADLTTAVCLICAVLFAGSSVYLYSLIDRVDRQIGIHERQSDPNVIAMNEIIANAGFGGMIHAFKNYLLRGGDELRVFDQSSGAMLSNLGKLERQLGPDYEDEIEAIESVVLEYQDQAEVIRSIRVLDDNAEGIDAVVMVDDTYATAAMGVLRSLIIEDGAPTKSTALHDIRRTLGYSGLVHHFKNFVLRKTPDYEAAARQAADRAETAIAVYRATGLNETEAECLEVVAQTVAQFRANIDVVRDMVDQGATAQEIDAVVLIPHQPAVDALNTLAKENQIASRAALAQLHETMALLRFGAILMTVLVCAGVLAFSFGLRWTIERVAVRPAAAIADGVSRIARGETHLDLSPWASDTEIGRIAAASRTFREALVDNIRKAEDLRGLSLERDDMLREHARMVAERAEYTTKRAALETLRAEEQDELQNLRDAIGTVVENLENGIFNYRIDEDYDALHLGGLARDINLMLRRVDDAFHAVAEAVVKDTELKFGEPSQADAQAAAIMRESMAHALQTLSEAIDEVQRGAATLRYAKP